MAGRIRRYYDRVARELAPDPAGMVLPARIHAVVLVSRLHKPTLRAVAYARATRPDVLEAVTVNVDDADTKKLMREWQRRKIPVALKVVESPYREITKPVLDYVKRVRSENPRSVVTVFPDPLTGACGAPGRRKDARRAQAACLIAVSPFAVMIAGTSFLNSGRMDS